MEIRIVEQPGYPPRHCSVCRCSAGDGVGPFAEYAVKLMVPTPNGLQEIDHWIALCIGSKDRPGCLVDAVRQSGGMAKWDVERHQHLHDEQVAQLREKVRLLEQRPAELRVVPFDEVIERIEELVSAAA